MSYLKSIYVFNNFVDRNFEIDFSPSDGEEFRHLILTGRNGSGKTNTLKALHVELFNLLCGLAQPQNYYLSKVSSSQNGTHDLLETFTYNYPKVETDFNIPYSNVIDKGGFVYTYFEPTRQIKILDTTLTEKVNYQHTFQERQEYYKSRQKKQREIIVYRGQIEQIKENIANAQTQIEHSENLINLGEIHENRGNQEIATRKSSIKSYLKDIQTRELEIAQFEQCSQITIPKIILAPQFLQFLLYKKKEQAYAIADGENDLADELTNWFGSLEKRFQEIFEESELQLKHSLKQNKFYFQLPNGRTFDFNQLAHGHSSILAIVSDIMLHIDAHREQFPEDVNPQGIVLIDEIENHLHPSLQEKILPFLTKLFPRIQFIIATHSPAVIASIDNATIYDLSSHEVSNENLTGMQYGVLMQSHFGLESEYSISVEKKLRTAKMLIMKEKRSKEENEMLKVLGHELGDLSPDLALDIYLELEKQQRENLA